MKTILRVAICVVLTIFISFDSYSQCTPNFLMNLGNGNDGEGIAYNPNDGFIYHHSGISDGFEFMERVDPIGSTVGPNLYGPLNEAPDPPVKDELLGIAWYPPLNVFIVSDRDDDLYHMTTSGVFTEVSTSFGYYRGFAVVGSRIYASDPFSDAMHEFNPNTGAIINTINLFDGAGAIDGAQGLTANPSTGEVYVAYKPNGSGGQNRFLGTVNLSTGEISSLGATGTAIAGLTFGPAGFLYAVTGDGANTNPESIYVFPASCVPPAAIAANDIPTVSEWGLILFGLLFLTGASVILYRKRSYAIS